MYRTKLYPTLKVLLLLLFVAHYSSIRLFYHSHLVDGVLVSHSHFYWFGNDSTSEELPKHSAPQLLLIQDHNQINWSNEVYLPAVKTPIYVLFATLVNCPFIELLKAETYYLSLRAPPFYIV